MPQVQRYKLSFETIVFATKTLSFPTLTSIHYFYTIRKDLHVQ